MLTLQILQKRAKDMLENPTKHEKIMCECFELFPLEQIKKQFIIAPYIVDFFCPSRNLVIEIDGNFHDKDRKQQNYDMRRDQHISSFGLRVWRLRNLEIEDNLLGIIDKYLQIKPIPSKGLYRKIDRNNRRFIEKRRIKEFRKMFAYCLIRNVQLVINWKYYGRQRPTFK